MNVSETVKVKPIPISRTIHRKKKKNPFIDLVPQRYSVLLSLNSTKRFIYLYKGKILPSNKSDIGTLELYVLFSETHSQFISVSTFTLFHFHGS